jgi:glutamate-1-semialdehyde aminotransferase
VGPVAALATLKKYQRERAEKKLIASGNQVKDFWCKAALAEGLDINVTGLPTLAAFSFNSPKSTEMNTRFTIEMLKEGFLGFRQFKPSLAHNDEVLGRYQAAVQRIFKSLAADPACVGLDTPRHHSGFQRLTKE